jgi:hypothetical protein
MVEECDMDVGALEMEGCCERCWVMMCSDLF